MVDMLLSFPILSRSSNKEVFVYVFPSIGHLSAIKHGVQAHLNVVVKIIAGFVLLDICLDVVIKPLVEGTLATVVQELSVDCFSRSHILLC